MIFQIFLFYLLVFSCVEVGVNDPNGFLHSATTSYCVNLCENGDILVNTSNKVLALKHVRSRMKFSSHDGWVKRINLVRSCCFW